MFAVPMIKHGGRAHQRLDFRVFHLDTDIMATVFITPNAHKQAERLPKEIHRRIMKLAKRLEKWPEVSGAKPLSGKMAGWYRLRTGDYRLRFRIKDEIITVDKIGHRSDFYEE
jgi:mRNA interferase RelE/StbE